MTAELLCSEDLSILRTPVAAGLHEIPNRLCIQPMEGCDGLPDGSPGELTIRRYKRFSESGAGLVWFEATAVVHEGRANPRQLYLHKANTDAFARLTAEIRERSRRTTGTVPMIIMQITHSGRYSKPDGNPEPVIARNNPLFEGENPLPPERIISDASLKRLEEVFAKTAKLAARAGFDAIDVKSCHGYLINELHASHTRPGIYGGSFENRTRFFRNVVTAARAVVPRDFLITTRINIYDGWPSPYGFGVSVDGSLDPDLTEPIELIKWMNPEIMGVTMGNPYQNPQVNRPTELAGVERMLSLTGQMQKAFPRIPVVGSGFTFLRENAGSAAAGMIKRGLCALAGFGRMAFAYPAIANDILEGKFDKNKTCIICGKCSQLMRMSSVTGCVARDSVYTEIFRDIVKK